MFFYVHIEILRNYAKKSLTNSIMKQGCPSVLYCIIFELYLILLTIKSCVRAYNFVK